MFMLQQKLHYAKDSSGRVVCLADMSGYKRGDQQSEIIVLSASEITTETVFLCSGQATLDETMQQYGLSGFTLHEASATVTL
jgi:predicted GNAT family N-acyltransferase